MNIMKESLKRIMTLKTEYRLKPEVLNLLARLCNSDCYLGVFVLSILVSAHKKGIDHEVMGGLFEFIDGSTTFDTTCALALGDLLDSSFWEAFDEAAKNNFGMPNSISWYYQESEKLKSKTT